MSQGDRIHSTDLFRLKSDLETLEAQTSRIETAILDHGNSFNLKSIKEEFEYLLFLHRQFQDLQYDHSTMVYDYSLRIKEIQKKILSLNNKHKFVPDEFLFLGRY